MRTLSSRRNRYVFYSPVRYFPDIGRGEEEDGSSREGTHEEVDYEHNTLMTTSYRFKSLLPGNWLSDSNL